MESVDKSGKSGIINENSTDYDMPNYDVEITDKSLERKERNMALNTLRRYRMTKEQEAEFEETLSKYEPYSDEELDNLELDGYYDDDRMKATMAKIFLANKEIID